MYSRIHTRIRHPVFAIRIVFVTWCIRSSPSEHVNGVFKKVSQTLALFRSIKHLLPKWSKIMFYNAYIMPHLDYWGDCSDLNKLVKVAANERLGLKMKLKVKIENGHCE